MTEIFSGQQNMLSVQTMNPDLKLLIELQELDSAMGGLSAEIQRLPRKIAEIEGQLATHIQKREADQQALAGNQQARRKRENEIAALREKISRYRNQMLDVKTNEQYRAFLHEIEFHETEIRKLEDEILAEMVASESLEESLRESEQSLAEERAHAQQEITAAEKQKREEEKKLSDVQARREAAQQRLTADVYARYQRIAALRKGLAVAPASDGACQGCYVRLRPQAYNDVKTNQQILICESCDRILYYVPPPPPTA